MFNWDIIVHEHVFGKGCRYIFASRIGIVKLFYFLCNTLQRKKKRKIFLALNFRLAIKDNLKIYNKLMFFKTLNTKHEHEHEHEKC
jgi:hypothetical protein